MLEAFVALFHIFGLLRNAKISSRQNSRAFGCNKFLSFIFYRACDDMI
jgi:hypothetical protein